MAQEQKPNILKVKEDKIEDENSVINQSLIKIENPLWESLQSRQTSRQKSLSAELVKSLTKNVTIKKLGSTTIKITKKPESRPQAEPINMTTASTIGISVPVLNYIRLLEKENADLRHSYIDCEEKFGKLISWESPDNLKKLQIVERPPMLSAFLYDNGGSINSKPTQTIETVVEKCPTVFKIIPNK